MGIRDYIASGISWMQGDSAFPKSYGGHHRIGDIIVNTHTGDWFEDPLQDAANAGRLRLIKSSPVQAAVRLISTSVADLVCNTLCIVDELGERVEPTTAQAEVLNLLRYEPNVMEDGYGFIANVTADFVLEGNGLIGIDRVGQRVNRLYRLMPRDARVGRDSMGGTYYTGPVSMMGGTGMTFNRMNLIHARLVNFEGDDASESRRGFVKGPVYTLAQTMLINGYLDEYIVRYFTSDANGIRMFIRATGNIGKEETKTARDYVAEVAKKNRGLAYLDHRFEPVAAQISAIDSSMAALRTFQVREASRIFGVPVPMLGEEKSGTSIAALKQDFWHNCVKPAVNTLLAAMTAKLLNQRNGPKGHRFAVNPMEMFKGDPELLAKMLPALGDAQRPGILRPTEMRQFGGLPAAMPEETETDRQVYEDLAKRQSGLPRGGDQGGGMGTEVNTGATKEPSDDDQGED